MLDPRFLGNGQEQYENFKSSLRGKKLIQYDYRSKNGELFSCVAPSVDVAKEKRALWLLKK